jgi:hypothetical protein
LYALAVLYSVNGYIAKLLLKPLIHLINEHFQRIKGVAGPAA